MTIKSLNPMESAAYRLEHWREIDNYPPSGAIQNPCESLPEGTNLCRRDWVTLNRARAGVGRTGDNLRKWGLAPSAECLCGHPYQTMQHILSDCSLGPVCSDLDLFECNRTALQWIQCWRDKIGMIVRNSSPIRIDVSTVEVIDITNLSPIQVQLVE